MSVTATRVVNTVLGVIVGFIAVDVLFRLLQANEGNAIVAAVRAVAGLLLMPFADMFPEQSYLLTALVGALGYALLAALALVLVSGFHRRRTGTRTVEREVHVGR